ncbi:hypothetical protein [Candidatus Albibeggiatoa sp. nov. BB20]|uniref:hypothetical protein n=1 Tax=Candidatus Albibeggiatoa sp. nov. BB20 TaxID=3162723 RepID=UPI003365A70F
MDSLVLNSSETAQWHTLICDAEQTCHTHLGETLQSYLVFLLMRYTKKAHLVDTIVALEYLHSLEATGHHQEDCLQTLGDKCLLSVGLFPRLAQRRRVKMRYYVDMGVNAYSILATTSSKLKAELFDDLAQHFVVLMDVLHATREVHLDIPSLEPLEAMELWSDIGSHHARQCLNKYTQATPIAGYSVDKQGKAIIH